MFFFFWSLIWFCKAFAVAKRRPGIVIRRQLLASSHELYPCKAINWLPEVQTFLTPLSGVFSVTRIVSPQSVPKGLHSVIYQLNFQEIWGSLNAVRQ